MQKLLKNGETQNFTVVDVGCAAAAANEFAVYCMNASLLQRIVEGAINGQHKVGQ